MFGSSRKPRQFNYQPRYYDPKQEERDQRDIVNGVSEQQKYIPGSIIKMGRFKRMVLTEEEKKQNRKVITTRLVVFAILLAVVAYFLVTFSGFEVMVQSFQGK